MPFDTMILSKKGFVATLTLNRPDRLNAMNPHAFAELSACLDEIEKDENVRVMILTGAGRGFCTGADTSQDATGSKVLASAKSLDLHRALRKSQAVVQKLYNVSKPTIAMVNGIAFGAGFDMALSCDIRIGCDKSRFKVGFTTLAMVPGTGCAWLMTRILGPAKTSELIYTDDFIEAEEALKIGMLNRLVPSDKLADETTALADKIARNPPVTLKFDKMLLRRSFEFGFDTAQEMAAATQVICTSMDDHKEGLNARREKRTPNYKGT